MIASRPPSLRAIAAFESAARHESFAKAADELHLTQSAISHSIRGLEDQLGARLFHRRGRQVVLTPDGRWLADRLRLSLILLSQALEGLGSPDQAATLTVACPAAFAERVLLRRWPEFEAAHPLVGMELRCDLGLRDVEAGEADVCIHFGGGVAAGLSARAMTADPLVPVAAPGRELRLQSLSAADLIESREYPWALWYGRTSTALPAGRPGMVVSGCELAITAAKRGLGACLAPASLVEEELAAGGLVALGPAAVTGSERPVVVWAPSSAKRAQIESFADWLCAAPPPAAAVLQGPARDAPAATAAAA